MLWEVTRFLFSTRRPFHGGHELLVHSREGELSNAEAEPLRGWRIRRSACLKEPCVPPADPSRQKKKIMSKDSQMRAAINQKLIEMGERERLKELLRAKLVECGWKDQLKAHCKDVIKEKGLEHVTVEDLVTEVTPKGRALVPDSVKKELLQRIRAFLAQHATL
ncbi:transcription and mRNA export factor ENY2-2-like [Spinachia spinachia]